MKSHRVVIVGCGFGGMYVARTLRRAARQGKIHLTLVNRTNAFLFTPLLHEVATGGLTPTSVTEPLREIFAGTPIEIVRGNVTTVNRSKKTLTIEGTTIAYDTLVLATGADTNDFGVKGVKSYAYTLKTLADAVRMRERIIDVFENATRPDGSDSPTTPSFVVVGGGATGVELAAELIEFSHGIAKRYHQMASWTAPMVTLVASSPELLGQFPAGLREAALNELKQKGIDVRLSAAVASVTAHSVHLADGTVIPADMTCWTAGVRPQLPEFLDANTPMNNGRLLVGGTLRLVEDPSVYALGDAAACLDETGKPLPMLAQVAVQQADVVGANILASLQKKPLKTFHYESRGALVSLGEWFAVGELFSASVRGAFAWWVWRTVYLFKFFSWKKRVRIAFEWTLELFWPRDITTLG